MREPLSIRVTTYALLALFVFMVAVPLFWMVTTALKTNKDLYEDFTYLPRHPTLQHFIRVIERDGLLTNIWNSFRWLGDDRGHVVVSAFAAFSIVRYKYRGGSGSAASSCSSTCCRPRCCSCRSTRSWSRWAWQHAEVADAHLSLVHGALLHLDADGYFRSIRPSWRSTRWWTAAPRSGPVPDPPSLSAPGIVASAIFSFTLAWNEFLLAWSSPRTRPR